SPRAGVESATFFSRRGPGVPSSSLSGASLLRTPAVCYDAGNNRANRNRQDEHGMSTLRIGKFQVQDTLGTGAHSTILHVRRRADAKHYALKVVPIGGPEDHKFLEQARHEFEVAQALDPPNLIKISALETVRDWLFRVRKAPLLIEYVNGKTLDTIPRLSVPRLVQVFEKVASALVHMHRRQVFHA